MIPFKLIRPVILLCVLCFCASCTDKKNSDDATKTKSNSRSIYKNQLKIEYSKSFDIEYLDSAKVITVFTHESSRKESFQYLLVPKKVSIPKGYENAQVIRTPINSAIVLTSIYVGFLDKINSIDNIVAVDNSKYIYSSHARDLIDRGKITEVGDSYELNIEKVFNLKPDLVFTYGIGNPFIDGNPKLIQNGIHIASATFHLENSPLARAEWIKFVAAFFDKEKEANEVFNGIADHYNKLTELTKNISFRPTVFTEAIFGGVWYEPGGNSYMSKLLNDAGAEYLWKDNKSSGSLRLNYEQVFEEAHDADFWVNVLFWTKLSDALKNDSRNSMFKSYRNKNIYNNNASLNKFGFYEYWETGILNCDLVLSDLIKIFHPELLPEYKLKYYKKLLDN
ncbi:MAG: ABC transporter substrate-binding protein [Ignavibacteriales bacterium]|nr:ABC transporter substrate-binding protein [Ignavibacteriales bacterium]